MAGPRFAGCHSVLRFEVVDCEACDVVNSIVARLVVFLAQAREMRWLSQFAEQDIVV